MSFGKALGTFFGAGFGLSLGLGAGGFLNQLLFGAGNCGQSAPDYCNNQAAQCAGLDPCQAMQMQRYAYQLGRYHQARQDNWLMGAMIFGA
jgi:hypothetical protein